MDGHGSPAADDGRAGEGYPEWCQDCTQTLALIIRRCLQELVGDSEPSGEVWELILARLRGVNCIGHSTPSGPCGSPR
jgi:hypothetical protein